mmetsp:Transcript_42406/g.102511  ORF Transcript_42406/g.102511 Transcript_42406/m.102511 type:complete len:226 (-) Transcript_42406:942-1619(-)
MWNLDSINKDLQDSYSSFIVAETKLVYEWIRFDDRQGFFLLANVHQSRDGSIISLPIVLCLESDLFCLWDSSAQTHFITTRLKRKVQRGVLAIDDPGVHADFMSVSGSTYFIDLHSTRGTNTFASSIWNSIFARVCSFTIPINNLYLNGGLWNLLTVDKDFQNANTSIHLRKLEFIEERLDLTCRDFFDQVSHMALDDHCCVRTLEVVKGPKDCGLLLLNDSTDT